jgi:hypothetical protein
MISKKVIFGSIGFSLIVSIISIITQNPKEFENSRFGIFIKILSSLAFILVAMGLVLTAQAFEQGQKLTSVDQTFKLIDRALMNPISKMRDLYPKCPHFVESLWPQVFTNSTTKYVEEKEDKVSILDLSMVMLQSFEDHFTGSGFDVTGEIVWAGNFLQWGNSDSFRDMWKELYPNFKESTNKYAELVFEYSNKGGKIKNGKDLMDRSIEFAKDERVLVLLRENSAL